MKMTLQIVNYDSLFTG